MQLQEGWFSYVNSHLILFVTQSTKSFIPVFKRKSLLCNDKEFQCTVPVLLPSTCCCMVNITGFIHLMLPAVCFGVNFPKGLIYEKSSFCRPIWSYRQLSVVHIATTSESSAGLMAAACIWGQTVCIAGNVAHCTSSGT